MDWLRTKVDVKTSLIFIGVIVIFSLWWPQHHMSDWKKCWQKWWQMVTYSNQEHFWLKCWQRFWIWRHQLQEKQIHIAWTWPEHPLSARKTEIQVRTLLFSQGVSIKMVERNAVDLGWWFITISIVLYFQPSKLKLNKVVIGISRSKCCILNITGCFYETGLKTASCPHKPEW